jgi:hypothetical protein
MYPKVVGAGATPIALPSLPRAQNKTIDARRTAATIEARVLGCSPHQPHNHITEMLLPSSAARREQSCPAPTKDVPWFREAA